MKPGLWALKQYVTEIWMQLLPNVPKQKLQLYKSNKTRQFFFFDSAWVTWNAVGDVKNIGQNGRIIISIFFCRKPFGNNRVDIITNYCVMYKTNFSWK